MMQLLRRAIGAALVFVAGPAWAQSLSNGEPLQFNHEYHCNGERVVVGHCRDSNPASYCMVYYPDRPSPDPPTQVQKAEQLREVITKLSACGSQANVARAAPPSASADQSDAGAPGLGRGTWRLLTTLDDSATFYKPREITRNAKPPRGWFTTVFSDPQDFGSGVTGVVFTQTLMAADCAHRSTKLLRVASYDKDQKLIGRGAVADGPFERVTDPGSVAADKLSLLCGGRSPVKGDKPLTGDGEYLWEMTRIILSMQEQDAKQ